LTNFVVGFYHLVWKIGFRRLGLFSYAEVALVLK